MADRDASPSGRLGRLRARLDRWWSAEDREDDATPRWVHVLQVLSTAFVIVSIDVVWRAVASLPRRVGRLARGSAAALDALLPWLIVLAVLGVAVCVVVVALSVRDL